jgi:acylglycerol lipase
MTELLNTPFFNTPVNGAVDFPSNPADATAMLLIVHGLAEHRGRYRKVIEHFNANGIAVCSFDHRGHGETASRMMTTRGDVESFDALIADTVSIIDGLKMKYPQLPLFVWGHSMGAAIATLAVSERPTIVRGAITSSPPYAAFDSYSKSQAFMLTWMARLLPAHQRPLPVNPDRLSRDPDVARAYTDDPMVPKAVTLRLLVGLYNATQRGLRAANKLRTPWLLLHGGSDRVAPPIGSQRLHDALGSLDKQIMFWPAARHEIHNELDPERAEFLARVIEWIRARGAPKN